MTAMPGAGLLAAGLGLLLQQAPAAPNPAGADAPPRILVVPFEAPGRDGRTYWLGEAAALVMTDDLNARGLGAITRAVRERAYDQLHLPHGPLSRATLIKMGELVGAVEVIAGEVRVDGEALIVRAQPVRIDVGRADPEVVERGNLADLFAVVQRVSRRAAPGGNASAAPPPPSLQAFEPYVKGLIAEQPATQASFLEAALKVDPSYHRARLALWDVRNGQGDHDAALAAARAVPAGAPESRRARFLAAISLIASKQDDEAFTLLNQLQDASPDPAVMNNLGIIQLHRTVTPETGKPVYYFTKAAERDPDNADILFNLGYAYALDRDPQGALYWLREALRRDPADADTHIVLASVLDSSGNGVEATREREIAGQLSSRYAEPSARREPLSRGLARPSPDLDTAGRSSGAGQAISTTSQRDQQDVAQFHLERGRRLFQAEQDREAMAELQRAVFLSPYEAEAHLLIGRMYLRAGRPREAVSALKISIWSTDTAAAHAVLAEAYLRLDDKAAARTEAQKALTLDPGSPEAKALLDKIGDKMKAWIATGLLIAATIALAAADRAPIVETATVDGIIHPVSSEFMRSAIAKADAEGAALIVFTLHTPGGLLDSTRDINNAIIAAKTPVAVFVGPAGNRAASAGFLITMAADIAAMAPGTHIGAAHPVAGNGEKLDEVMAKKMASDTAAYARTLATQRGRNVPLVEQAVTDSRSFTENEAASAVPPLIDVIATDVPDLLKKLDGRVVKRFNGTPTTLRLSNADVRVVEMTLAQRVLSAIAHPQIAYLLLTLGTLGLTIELWSPGAIVPGVAGGICLLLAFFALQVLPVSYAGLLLMLLGFVLLVLEVKVTSHGLLAVGGIASLLFGSMMLIDSPQPELQIGLRLILPVTLSLAGILLFLVTLGLRAQAQPATTGESGMLLAPGQALTPIPPGGVGRVATHGEIWTATSSDAIHQGDPVVVTAVTGLVVTVRRA